MTSLLLTWIATMALIGALGAVHTWTPEHFPSAVRQAAVWCTTLTVLAAVIDLMRHP